MLDPAAAAEQRVRRTIEPLRFLEVPHLEVAQREVVQAFAPPCGLGAV